MAALNLRSLVYLSYLLIIIQNITVLVKSSSPSSDEEELDEKTKEALEAQAGMNTPGPGEIVTALYLSKIIPDMLDRAPNITVNITWPGGAEAKLGNKLSPKEITEPPQSVTWADNNLKPTSSEDHYFTLLFTGPDHPSKINPEQREFLFWHQVNIHGYSQVSHDSLVAYLAPKPANGTGKHRYVLCIYRQPSKLDFDEPAINETDYEDRWRIHWDTRHFAKKYNLGDPYAVNFFYSEFQG
nr:PREDICTED: protein D3-like [Bemisia tabaci]